MFVLLMALAGFLLGGLIAFRRQGKPLGIQLVMGAGALVLVLLALRIEMR